MKGREVHLLVYHPPVVEAEEGPPEHAILGVVEEAVVPNEALPALDVIRGVPPMEGHTAEVPKEQPCPTVEMLHTLYKVYKKKEDKRK